MQLPMIGTMEVDRGQWRCTFSVVVQFRWSFLFLAFENGNHSNYADDECDSSSHPQKISIDEDLLPSTTMPVDEEDDEPGKLKRVERQLPSLMSTSSWTEGSSVWSLEYPRSIFLSLTVDLWRAKMRRKMPIDDKEKSDPYCDEETIPFFFLIDIQYRHTMTMNKKTLTRSSIIKWEHVPEESRLIPPTVTSECSGISSSSSSSFDVKKRERLKWSWEEKIIDRWMISFAIETYRIKSERSTARVHPPSILFSFF